MKRITIFVLVGAGLVLAAYLVKSLMFNDNSASPQNTNIDLSTNPNYCQADNDCVAITNPSNGCYYGYFNKNAAAAIKEFESNKWTMIQDCPNFGQVYCDTGNNKCTANRLN